MINTKYNYYKTVKWKDIYTFKKYNNTVKVVAYYNTTTRNNSFINLNRLTDKLVMRKLVKKFRKDNKLANDINLISTKEQYWY